MKIRSKILSLGSFVPSKVVKNSDLEELMNTSDEWISQRSGIQERRWAVEGESVSGMALKASEDALNNANLKADHIDAIIFSTLFSDFQFPGGGVQLQHKLGCTKCIPALDIRNQCSGFLYALSVADSWIRSGTYKRILIATSELHNSSMNKSPAGRDLGVLFGDGAASCILEATEVSNSSDLKQSYVIDTMIYSEGQYAEKLALTKPSPNDFPRVQAFKDLPSDYYPYMDGKFVFKNAIHRMCESIHTILTKNQLSISDIDFVIPHQANMRINQLVMKELGMSEDKTHYTIDRFGNTTSATIPLTLHEAMGEKKVKAGDLVAFVAFGSGFTWGASLVRI